MLEATKNRLVKALGNEKFFNSVRVYLPESFETWKQGEIESNLWTPVLSVQNWRSHVIDKIANDQLELSISDEELKTRLDTFERTQQEKTDKKFFGLGSVGNAFKTATSKLGGLFNSKKVELADADTTPLIQKPVQSSPQGTVQGDIPTTWRERNPKCQVLTFNTPPLGQGNGNDWTQLMLTRQANNKNLVTQVG